tara:strand:- start:456 stop:596 length:141 start_codon:yes stop_codon:yes gene_type:complete
MNIQPHSDELSTLRLIFAHIEQVCFVENKAGILAATLSFNNFWLIN